MSNISKYGSAVTPEAVGGIKSKTEKGGKYLRSLPEGLTKARLVVRPGTQPWVYISQHFVPTEDGRKAVFNCPTKMANRPCPGCALEQQIRATDAKLADNYRSQDKVLLNVIVRGKEAEGVKIWQAPVSVFRQLMECYEAQGKPDFGHPITGRDILVMRRGQGMNTKYPMVALSDVCTLAETEEQIDAWMEAAEDLTEYTKVLTFQEITAKIQGQPQANTQHQVAASAAQHLGGAAAPPSLPPGQNLNYNSAEDKF